MAALTIGSIAFGAVLIAGCGTDGTDDADTAPVGLAPPVVIDVTGTEPAATPGEMTPGEMTPELGADDALGSMSIAPGAGDLADTQPPVDWVWVTTRFVVTDSLGALPTDDVAFHYPPGPAATLEQVRALATQLGVAGEPVPGDAEMGSQWVVETDDQSGARLEVSDDAMLSWWMTGGTRRPDLESGAPAQFGRLDYASGYLAEAIPTGPYPLIGIDEALERLATQWGSWSMAVPGYVPDDMPGDDGVDGDAPVASPETPVSDQIAIDEPVEDPTITEMEVELVSVTADLWSSWAADGSMWMLPAYRFEGSDGGIYTIAAITDEYLVQMDPYALPDPGRPIVDPPFIEDPFDGLDLDGVGDTLVGLTLSEAEELIYENGWSWVLRSVRVDGEDLAVTADYQPNRVNMVTEDGIITEVLSFG